MDALNLDTHGARDLSLCVSITTHVYGPHRATSDHDLEEPLHLLEKAKVRLRD